MHREEDINRKTEIIAEYVDRGVRWETNQALPTLAWVHIEATAEPVAQTTSLPPSLAGRIKQT